MPFNIIETDLKPKRNVSKESEIDIEDISFVSKKFNIEYQGSSFSI